MPSASPPSLSPATARRLVWLAGGSHAVNHYTMLIFPAILLLVRQEFGLGYAALGLIANGGLLAYGLGALPAGILADRWGGTRLLAVWLVGGSLSTMAMALATGPVDLALGFAALGLFASLHHPAGSGVLVILRGLPGADMGRAFGLSGLLGNLGMAAAPILSATAAARWGWRAAFWIGAVPGLLLGPALWRLPLPPPPTRRQPWLPPWRSLSPPLLVLFALETLMGFIFQGFSTFFPTHLAESGQIPGLTASQVTRGGSLASLALLFGGLGHLAAGRVVGSRYREAALLATMAISTACLFAMGLLGGPWLVVVSATMTFTYFALGTLSNTFIAALVPAHLAGTAFGITFALALGVGSLAASSMGAIAQGFGLPRVFLVLAGIGLGGLGLVGWFVRLTGRGLFAPASAGGAAEERLRGRGPAGG